MTNEELVKQTYPGAYLYIHGVHKEIRRPRYPSDPVAVVKYMLISNVCYTEQEAWDDAAKRIRSLE